ncbi:dihydrolipoyl dehydrogenase family protein [Desulforhopalus sp. 52FAK]
MVMGDMRMDLDVVVIGAGPGGLAAAFRASELGFDVALVDCLQSPGGNHLHETCTPQQFFLDIAQQLEHISASLLDETLSPTPCPNLQKIRQSSASQIDNLTNHLSEKCKQKGVLYIKGKAYFESSTTIRLKDSEITGLSFKYAVIATGSSPSPFHEIKFEVTLTDQNRVVSPSESLNISTIPDNLLVVGAGPTGLEMANIFSALGSKVDIVEQNDTLLPYVDDDLISLILKSLQDRYNSISLNTLVTGIIETENEVLVKSTTSSGNMSEAYNLVILATGRIPSSDNLGLENTKVNRNVRGFISTDSQQRTDDKNIFAVGDITNSTMQSNIATRQGKIAAEVIAGISSAFDLRAIPYTINTSPTLSWCGLTEKEAKLQNIPVKVQSKSWNEEQYLHIEGDLCGLTKIISTPEDGRILGVAVVGRGSAELIGTGVLAIEMGALVEDLSLILQAHPTRSEFLGKAAQTTQQQDS